MPTDRYSIILSLQIAAWEADQQQLQQKAAEKVALEQEAALIAFDRANHMGISQSTVQVSGCMECSAVACLPA